VLTLPMTGLIKQHFPKCKILFLGRTYTKDVINLCEHVDEFINYDDIEKLSLTAQVQKMNSYQATYFLHVFPTKEIAQLAKKSNIPTRIGTTNRLYHWVTCNKLIKLSRKNSNFHEAQLNFKLLNFLGIDTHVELKNIQNYYGFTKIPELDPEYKTWINAEKFNLILHPKSKGSAREWGLANFESLVNLLPKEQFTVFVSGTKQDAEHMQTFLKHPNVIDITGKLSLEQFIAFINNCNGLVAASTGPLHIAAALNKKAIGLFAPMRPIFPQRWAPLGKQANALVQNKNCQACKKTMQCACILEITPQRILNQLLNP
jgi:heptosyltransferase III